MSDEVLDTDSAARRQSDARKSRRADPVSLVAGLLFIAITVATLTDRFWTDIDPVLVVGGAIVAVGVAIAASVIRRSRRGEQPGS
ncbi:MAG: hypothetical protein F4011_07855 [Acidimicrobiaceae bacterium]|nr:hypothetical protein [Acidimicrobiaceae bacterium]